MPSGKPTRSCVTALGDVAGKKIISIEGLGNDGQLHPLQTAFLELGAMQCGYCTAGMIMGGVALLEKNKAPTAEEVTRALDGHICRCGTYPRITLAVRKAAEMLKGGGR